MKIEITTDEIVETLEQRIKENVGFDDFSEETKDVFQRIVIDKIHDQLNTEDVYFQKQLIIDEIVDQTMSGLAPMLQVIKTITSHQMEEN